MDYANGKIYMLEPTCEYDEGDVYYGSTASTLVKRLSQHKKPSNNLTSRLLLDKYGRDNIKIVLMEAYPCSCVDELKAVEAKYQRENKCVNKRIEGRTQKEYYQDNHEAITEKQKEYRTLNREKINEYSKQNYYSNQEEINNRHKEYYYVNREKSREKITCECGRIVCRDKLTRHKKSKFHLENI